MRRVATLVARGAMPEEVFAAVTGEVGRLLGAHLAGMARYESDHTVTVLATWAAEGEQHPLVPGPWPLEGASIPRSCQAAVWQALRALARQSALPVELDLGAGRRLSEQVEVAAYYAVSEALANAAKHAHASVVHVELNAHDAMRAGGDPRRRGGGRRSRPGVGTGRAQRPHRVARRHVRSRQPRRRRHYAAHRDPHRNRRRTRSLITDMLVRGERKSRSQPFAKQSLSEPSFSARRLAALSLFRLTRPHVPLMARQGPRHTRRSWRSRCVHGSCGSVEPIRLPARRCPDTAAPSLGTMALTRGPAAMGPPGAARHRGCRRGPVRLEHRPGRAGAVLLRRRQEHVGELEGVLLRCLRSQGDHHDRQAGRVLRAAGAVGADLRLPPVVARAAAGDRGRCLGPGDVPRRPALGRRGTGPARGRRSSP